MDYIKGRLKILKDLEYFANTGYFYYSAVGTDMSLTTVDSMFSESIKEFTRVAVPIHFVNAGVTLKFNTITESAAVDGRYEAFMYPAEYGKLCHIYCVIGDEGEPLHIDLINTWTNEDGEPATVVYDDITYYLYIQDLRVKEEDVSYNFIFKNGGYH